MSTVNKISSEDLRLPAAEENTLRQVSGYIPYSLRQKYLKMKDSVTSREILSVIEFWCVNPASGSKKNFKSILKNEQTKLIEGA